MHFKVDGCPQLRCVPTLGSKIDCWSLLLFVEIGKGIESQVTLVAHGPLGTKEPQRMLRAILHGPCFKLPEKRQKMFWLERRWSSTRQIFNMAALSRLHSNINNIIGYMCATHIVLQAPNLLKT